MANEQQPDGDRARAPRGDANLRLIKWMLVGLFLYASVYVLGASKSFLVPIVLGFLLSMVFAPIRRFFDRRGVPSALSSLVIVVVLLSAMFAMVTALALPVTQWIDNASQIQNEIQTKLTTVSGPLDGLQRASERLSSMTENDSSTVDKVEVKKTDAVTQAAMNTPAMLAQIVFTLILLLFLLASGDMFYEKLVHVMPTFRDKKQAISIVHTSSASCRAICSRSPSSTLVSAWSSASKCGCSACPVR